jgi:hypothetical protein
MLAALTIVVLGVIFGERPTQKPAQSAAIQVATTR